MKHAEAGPGGQDASSGTSHSLLERARANDGDAWDRLVAIYGPLVYQWCQRWDLQDCDRADVFQQVFQAVASHIGRFRKERSGDTFRGWLRTITRNKIYDHLRKRQREPQGEGGTTACFRLGQFPAAMRPEFEEAELPESGRSESGPPGELGAARVDEAVSREAGIVEPDADEDQPAIRKAFRRALELIQAEFEPRTWKAFWEAAVEDRPAKDVAGELSMSPGAVRVAKSRVLQRLREELGDAE
jgi:RNA polymerase sigma-70 factor (ECF subfamily)